MEIVCLILDYRIYRSLIRWDFFFANYLQKMQEMRSFRGEHLFLSTVEGESKLIRNIQFINNCVVKLCTHKPLFPGDCEMLLLSFIYPERGGFGEILPEMMIIVEGKLSPNLPSEGYINALLYRKNTWMKKREKFNLQNKQCKFPPFWRARAWLPRVVTTNDISPHIPRSKPYSLVIFPAAFIFHAYKGDSALNHMLTWYKVISVIGQSKFEV